MQETPLPEIFDSRDEPAAAGAHEIQKSFASTAVANVDLLAVALSRFGDWRAGAMAIVERYRAVAFDLSTPKGYAELTKAIAEVRAPRFAAQNVSKASKSELAGVSRAVGIEEAAVTAFLDATENRLVALRDAHDEKVKAEKAEAKRLDEERIARLQAGLAKIRSFLGYCQGLPAARITLGIEQLQGQVYGDDWQEFAVPAANAQCETLEAMRILRAQTFEREAEAARLEAERKAEAARLDAQQADQERVAAEQALAAKQLSDQQAELAGQREALAAQAKALRAAEVALAEMAREAAEAEAKIIADAEQRARDQDAARIAAEQEAQRRHDAAEQVLLTRIKSIDALAASNQAALAASPAQPAAPVILPMPPAIARASVPASYEPATLTLGTICGRLGFTVSGAFLADELHVRPTSTDKRAQLYTEAQYQTICRQLLAHVGAMADLYEVGHDA